MKTMRVQPDLRHLSNNFLYKKRTKFLIYKVNKIEFNFLTIGMGKFYER